jgi:uncharacterized membrane protein YidH (DUF202 family)
MPKKKDSLSEERTALAEERTLLSYIRTFLTALGLALIFLKLYFEQEWWIVLAAIVLSIAVFLLIIEEVIRFRKIKRLRERAN